MTEYYSNAEWPEGTYSNQYGKPISSDNHRSLNNAFAVCKGLERDGFGGDGEVFPVRTWVSEEEGGEPIEPVLKIDDENEINSLRDVQNKQRKESSDRKEADALMSVLDQSMSRQLLGNGIFELANRNNPWELYPRPRRRYPYVPFQCVPELKGQIYIAPEKPLTKRDRQRLKKKQKKNKSY